MLLVAGPHPDFLKFIQVLCWIIVPVLVSVVLITIYLHYRKKKKEKAGGEEEPEDKLMMTFPGQVGYTNGNGEYVLFDHSDLMRQFKRQLSYSNARYTALQHEFTVIDSKYTELTRWAQIHFITHKKRPMENTNEQLPKHLQADIDQLAKDDAVEKKALQSRLDQLERSYERLGQENRSLKEQMSLQTATDEEKAAIINKWKEENIALKDKVTDQEYLEDLVEEKKAQVNFLQNQIEQRIKNLYQSEHQRLKAVAEMKEAKEDQESLKNELLFKQEQIDKTQVVLCEKEEQLMDKERIVNEKSAHITQLENILRETKEQNEQLMTSLAENRSLAGTLQQQLTDEQSKVEFLTQKLFINKQMMRKVHKEFSEFINEGGEESPVIPLRPGYINKENEEFAMQ
jgi:hypothetical protein